MAFWAVTYSMNTREVGRLGEQMAEKYLVEQKRARILARNFTVRGGEIDLSPQS